MVVPMVPGWALENPLTDSRGTPGATGLRRGEDARAGPLEPTQITQGANLVRSARPPVEDLHGAFIAASWATLRVRAVSTPRRPDLHHGTASRLAWSNIRAFLRETIFRAYSGQISPLG